MLHLLHVGDSNLPSAPPASLSVRVESKASLVGLQQTLVCNVVFTFCEEAWAWVVGCHVNTLGGKGYMPNRVNTLLSQSFTLNWIWRPCQVQSQCGGAKQNLLKTNPPNLALTMLDGWICWLGEGGGGGFGGRFPKQDGISVKSTGKGKAHLK